MKSFISKTVISFRKCFGNMLLIIGRGIHVLFGVGFCCRYVPTCSEYAQSSIEKHGLIKGFYIILFRVMRCHPLGGSGWDPVP